MLTWLRKKQRAILKWTLALVIPSFVAFYGWSEITGAGPQSPDNPDAWLIRVKTPGSGWEEINQWDFRQARESVLERYGNQLQNSFGPQAAQMMRQFEGMIGNERIALEAVDTALLRQYALGRGLTVSDDEVMQMIQQQFRGATPQEAKQYLANQNLTEQQFTAQLRYSMLLEKARREVASPAFVSVFEAWQEYSVGNQKVKIAALEFNQADFVDQVKVDEAALAEYYKENIETYRVPEKRAYEYVKIDRVAMSEQITPDDAALKTYYDAHPDEFAIPQGVKIRQILLTVPRDADEAAVSAKREEIEKLLARAKAGEDFAALADEATQDSSNSTMADSGSTETIKLGGLIADWITINTTAARYDKAAIEALLALKAGEISAPLRTPRGWIIAKAEELREASLPIFDEVKKSVEEKYKAAESRKLFSAQRQKLAEAIGNFTVMGEIAQAAGLTVQKTEPQDATNYFFTGLGNFISYELYFSDLQQGDFIPGIMDTPTADSPDLSVYMRLDQIIPTYLPELAEVRQRVEDKFKLVKALELAKTKANETLASITSIEDLEKAAAANGKELKKTNDLIKLSEINSSGLPRIEEFAAEVVRSPVNKPRVSDMQGFFGEDASGAIIWIIAEKEDADKAEFRKQADQLQAELLNLKRQTLLNEFLASSRAGATVEYNETMLPELASK